MAWAFATAGQSDAPLFVPIQCCKWAQALRCQVAATTPLMGYMEAGFVYIALRLLPFFNVDDAVMGALTEHAVREVHSCNERSAKCNGAPAFHIAALAPWRVLPK